MSEVEPTIEEDLGLLQEDTPEVEEAPVSSPPPEETAPPAPAEEEPVEYVSLDEHTRITPQEAAQLAQLQRAIATDPRGVTAAMVQQFLADEYDLVPRQQAPAPSAPTLDDETMFDPGKMRDFINYQIQQGVQAQVAPIQDELHRRQLAESHSYTKYATERFAGRHGLTQEQADGVAQEAARTGIIQSTAQGKDPITAVDEALERTYWAIPEYREHEARFTQERDRDNQKRQRKLAMVGGTSGSVPRTQPRPRTEQEKVAALGADLAAHMGFEIQE